MALIMSFDAMKPTSPGTLQDGGSGYWYTGNFGTIFNPLNFSMASNNPGVDGDIRVKFTLSCNFLDFITPNVSIINGVNEFIVPSSGGIQFWTNQYMPSTGNMSVNVTEVEFNYIVYDKVVTGSNSMLVVKDGKIILG